eukprot:s1405_g12.t1
MMVRNIVQDCVGLGFHRDDVSVARLNRDDLKHLKAAGVAGKRSVMMACLVALYRVNGHFISVPVERSDILDGKIPWLSSREVRNSVGEALSYFEHQVNLGAGERPQRESHRPSRAVETEESSCRSRRRPLEPDRADPGEARGKGSLPSPSLEEKKRRSRRRKRVSRSVDRGRTSVDGKVARSGRAEAGHGSEAHSPREPPCEGGARSSLVAGPQPRSAEREKGVAADHRSAGRPEQVNPDSASSVTAAEPARKCAVSAGDARRRGLSGPQLEEPVNVKYGHPGQGSFSTERAAFPALGAEGSRVRRSRSRGKEGRAAAFAREPAQGPVSHRLKGSTHPPAVEPETPKGGSPTTLREALESVMGKPCDPALVVHFVAFHAPEGGATLSSWMTDALSQQKKRRQGSLGATSPNIYPIPPWLVEELYPEDPDDIQAWVKLMVVVLNWCFGGTLPTPYISSANEAQIKCLTGLRRAVGRLAEEKGKLSPLPELQKQLKEVRPDHAGEPMCIMETLIAERVIAGWPAVEESAKVSAEDCVPEGVKELLLNPRMLLLPEDQWPDAPPKVKVRATQEEWTQLCIAGVQRGLFVGLPEDEVFHDLRGRPVFNGAMGVSKHKQSRGAKQGHQRFVPNLLPANSYLRQLPGSEVHLPYLLQMLAVSLDQDESLVMARHLMVNLSGIPLSSEDRPRQRGDTLSRISDGGGGAIASNFKGEPQRTTHDNQTCYHCGGDFTGEGRYPCPPDCGVSVCCLECIWSHRAGPCRRRFYPCPKFGERFAGTAGLTKAIAKVGGIEVQRPFDLEWNVDFFTPRGKAQLAELEDEVNLRAEHWAPSRQLFSQARGRRVRDEWHVMGHPQLPGDMKAQLRKVNTMALKAVKRGSGCQQRGILHTVEHPWDSWLWEMQSAKQLEEDSHTVAYSAACCFGGPSKDWVKILSNSQSVAQAVHRHTCECHNGPPPSEVERWADGTLYYPVEADTPYPLRWCQSYAQGLLQDFENQGYTEETYHEGRLEWLKSELAEAGGHWPSVESQRRAAEALFQMEEGMRPGEEKDHLASIARRLLARGADLGSLLTTNPAAGQLPYPAYRWLWEEKTGSAWRLPQGEEPILADLWAFIAMLQVRVRQPSLHATRYVYVVDSIKLQVAICRGWSSLPHLNKQLRQICALCLAADTYPLVMWTIRPWNFAVLTARRQYGQAPDFLATTCHCKDCGPMFSAMLTGICP